MERAREYTEEIYMCFINYSKAFDCVDLDNTTRHGLPRPSHTPVKLLMYLMNKKHPFAQSLERQTEFVVTIYGFIQCVRKWRDQKSWVG